MTIEFSDKELNCFLKEYILNETLNINEMMINKFNYFKQDINFKDLIYLVNYILYNFIPSEKINSNSELKLILFIKKIIEKNIENYENNNEFSLECIKYFIHFINFKTLRNNKSLVNIFDILKILINYLNDKDNIILSKNLINDFSKLSELTLMKCQIFLKINNILVKKREKYNNEIIHSLLSIMNNISIYLVNNFQKNDKNIFFNTIDCFIHLLNLSISILKIDEIYINYYIFYPYFNKLIFDIFKEIEEVKIIKEENSQNNLNKIYKMKKKILDFIILTKKKYYFQNNDDVFKCLLIFLDNFKNSSNLDEKLNKLGVEENSDELLKYIKRILSFILVMLRKKEKNIVVYFENIALNFIEKILFLFIEKETVNLDIYKDENSILTNSLLLIKEIIILYPELEENLLNFCINNIESEKGYFGLYLLIQFKNINNNEKNFEKIITKFIDDKLDDLINISYTNNNKISEIIVFYIISFLSEFSQIISNQSDKLIKSLKYIINHLYSESCIIRKNSLLKFCLIITEFKSNKEIIKFMNEISKKIIENLLSAPNEILLFCLNCLNNCLFENNNSIILDIFNSISEKIKNEFINYKKDNNDSNNNHKIIISNCFIILNSLLNNKFYEIKCIEEIFEIYLNKILPILKYTSINIYDDEIYQITELLLKKNINNNMNNQIIEYIELIPQYINQSKFISLSIFNLLNFLIINKSIDISHCENIVKKIYIEDYKINDNLDYVKINIILQSLVTVNNNLSEEFIINTLLLSLNNIKKLNTISNPYYYYTKFSFFSFIFSLFKNYSELLIKTIKSFSDFSKFIINFHKCLSSNISINILQCKFIVITLCKYLKNNEMNDENFTLFYTCYILMKKILNKERIENMIKSKTLIKFEYANDSDNEEKCEINKEFEIIKLNELYLRNNNSISLIKNNDEFKIFSDTFFYLYYKEKDFMDDKLDKLISNKKTLQTIIYTQRIDNNIIQNKLKNGVSFNFNPNENGGIPRKILKIKK